MSDLDIIKNELINRMRDVCLALLPDGREEGGQWVSFNPVEGDYQPGRLPALKVRLRGGVVGAWKDWRSGEAGDALKLVSYLNRTDTKGALAWARDFLGMRAMTATDRARLNQAAKVRRGEREIDDARRRAYRIEKARELADAGAVWGQNSAAERHAVAYWAARGLDVGLVESVNPQTFRFAPATEWWNGAEWKRENGRKFKAAPGPRFPAIHAAMRQWNGEVSCCHVTFLDPARPAKAPVQPPKLMFGEALGSVIEVAMGPSGRPFWRCDRPAPLIIAEGIETAWSMAVNVPEARVWAAGSLAGVGHAPVWLDCVAWVLFARDNNAGNRQAQKQFEKALAGLESHGKRIVVEASHVGDDFNDLAQGTDE